MGFVAYFFILCWAILESSIIHGYGYGYGYDYGAPHDSATHDVTKYGAVGNGHKDDSNAFESAWRAACHSSQSSVKILVPSEKTFLLSPVTFAGPCKSKSITVEILGTIVAQPRKAWKNKGTDQWLDFHRVDGLSVIGYGQGVIDGQGESWWGNGDDSNRPSALKFSHCKNLVVNRLKHKNSQKNHVSINGCHNADIANLYITAPQDSPNTDGIDISDSTNLHIRYSVMETGDDCIAINGGTSNVYISHIACGPGHGVSIGSLGKDGTRDEGEGIQVSDCTFRGTENGVRIKTWQGGSGFARNISFSDIKFIATDNPVIIDQFYCPHKNCDEKVSAVKISNIRYTRLRGTSSSKNDIIDFKCSRTVPCSDIILNDINIKPINPHLPASATCENADVVARSCNPNVNCL